MRDVTGSPPRAWGQLPGELSGSAHYRFTPTGVGTITRGVERLSTLPVHPHGRGDNSHLRRMVDSFTGSPPRAWGQSRGMLRVAGNWRFTPTGVGTIFGLNASACISSVHPHGRGDNRDRGFEGKVPGGSPPRAWGQSLPRHERLPRLRFTPTGVGTIRCCFRSSLT